MRSFIIVSVVLAIVYAWRHHAAPPFEHPVPLAVERSGSGVKKFRFEALLDAQTSFEELAKPGFYTVIEGYTDSCSVCRGLERDLPSLLDARHDVVLRRVRFSERGGKQFKGNTAEEVRAAFEAYTAQLKRYRSFDIRESGGELAIGTCGTPHVEVYRPDGSLIASDYCDGSVYKDGLVFLRQWIAAEQAR